MARLFINEDDINKHIDQVIQLKQVKDENISLWLSRNYKNFIKKDLKTKAVTEIEITDENLYSAPLKVKVGFKKGEKVYFFKATDNLKSNIEHCVDYLNTISNKNKIKRMAVKDAFKHGRDWIKNLNKDTIQKNVSKKNYEMVHEFKNGYYLVRLLKKEDFEQEGLSMNHCVASYFNDKYTKGEENQIWSLRNENDKSVATIELMFRRRNVSIMQFKGKNNRGIIDPKIAPELTEYFYTNYENVNWNDNGAFGPSLFNKKLNKYIPLALWDEEPFDRLDLSNHEISYLPEKLVVKGDLNIRNTPVSYIGENVKIYGDVLAEKSLLSVIHPKALIKGKVYCHEENMLISYGENIKLNTF